MKRSKWCKYCEINGMCHGQDIHYLCNKTSFNCTNKLQSYRDWLAKEIHNQRYWSGIRQHQGVALFTLRQCAKQLRIK